MSDHLSIPATAIPSIAFEFSSLPSVAWYASARFLKQMALQPLSGRLYSHSSSSLFLTALAIGIFEAGSLISMLATSSPMLIVGQAISGTGGAGVYVGMLALIAHAVNIRRRPAYLALCTSVFAVASVVGPLLGGYFADQPKLGWRWCSWINLRGFTRSLGFDAVVSLLPKAQ